MNPVSLLIALCLLVLARPALALSPQDFYGGYTISVEEEGAVYSLKLPAELYSKLQQADFGDVRVFNGQGQAVPHSIRRTPLSGETPESFLVPHFPLSANKAQREGGIGMVLEQQGGTTRLQVSSGQLSTVAGSEITGYLLDMDGIVGELGALELFWQSTGTSQVVDVTLWQSDDLDHWSPLVRKTSLVDMHFGGQRIEKRMIQLPTKTKRYFKLSWSEAGEQLLLDKVICHRRAGLDFQERQWGAVSLSEAKEHESNLVYYLDRQGKGVVDSLQLTLAQANSLVRAELQSRVDEKGTWRRRCDQVFYHLTVASTPVESRFCSFPAVADGEWRLLVHQDEAGLRESKSGLQLQLGWQPAELYFAAQGKGPYLLAYGSARVEGEKQTPSLLLATLEKEAVRDNVAQAELGEVTVLGGDKALVAGPAPLPWKKWLLWLVLLVGVTVLAVMARSLLREMKAGGRK